MNSTSTSSRRALVIDTNGSPADAEQKIKGLASEQRLRILQFLGDQICSINEIAAALKMPNSTVTLHINALEESGLIKTELTPANRGLQKVCSRLYDRVIIELPRPIEKQERLVEMSMPIGNYVDCQAATTCGLASETGIIGLLDDPKSFYEPDHVHAQLIWFRHGYVEYRFPNRLPPKVILDNLQLSMEICSEAPLHHDDWPSDITVWVNGCEIGYWTSPADFGGQRGSLTPEWWESWNTQYGLLKVWQVTQEQSYVDGLKISDVTLSNLNIEQRQYITIRIGVKEDAQHVGGLNLFGAKFGNYPQDLVMRLNFHPRD
jgi:predicted transcriptional regulator